MDSLLVVTDAAHGTPHELAIRRAVDALRARADVQVCPVSYPGELDSILHRRGGRPIVIAGNDTGLHTIVSALHRRNELDDAVLGILPVGPGNDFARSAGIPMALVDAAKVVLAGAQRRFDLIVDCRGDVVVNGAAVAGRVRRSLAGLGDLSGVAAFHDLASQPLHVRVVADEQVITDFDRPVIAVGVNNCASEERGHHRSPEADPCDGYADVVVSFASSRLGRVRNALRRNNHHLARADVVRLRAQTVSVSGQWFTLATDGEDTGAEQRCTWNVMPQRLRMIVPE